MHMNAAKEIVRLRGGIDRLNRNVLLRIVIFWYGSPIYAIAFQLLTWLR
jgi:hypothetical protein